MGRREENKVFLLLQPRACDPATRLLLRPVHMALDGNNAVGVVGANGGRGQELRVGRFSSHVAFLVRKCCF
jgi:hypothetical protein